MIGGPGKAADIVVRVIVVLAMVQPIPNTRKENLNIIITIIITNIPIMNDIVNVSITVSITKTPPPLAKFDQNQLTSHSDEQATQ